MLQTNQDKILRYGFDISLLIWRTLPYFKLHLVALEKNLSVGLSKSNSESAVTRV